MQSGWEELYRQRLKSADEAIAAIRPASRIFVSGGCAEPRSLVNALTARAAALPDCEIVTMLTAGKPPYTDEKYADSFRLNAFYITEMMRESVWKGMADYTPILLSEVPALFRGGRMRLDAALVQVSPPDKNGHCSLGIGVDIAMAAIESAAYVIAQVNRRMPRTHGDTFVPLKSFHALVEQDGALLPYAVGHCGPACRTIGQNISRLIEDGSTLQIGMGAIAESVLLQLGNHQDLGVHSETFSDALMELVKNGVITNARKSMHKGKVIAAFCMGSPKLYAFVNDNPMFEFHPIDYTNNRRVIASNDNMVSINSALLIDLTGQVSNYSIGYEIYGGMGGQVDFSRGAALSRGGKPIIALPSTSEDGEKSSIVPYIEEGTGVVTTRGDVHYVVTEYGTAYLHGKSIRERTLSLIQVAHPKFRDWLMQEAKKRQLVYQDQALKRDAVYPAQYELRQEMGGGLIVFFRPVKATDEKGLQRLIYGMSAESRFLRFFERMSRFPHRKAQELTAVDYEGDMAIVAIVERDGAEEIIAAGHYMLSPRTGMAEVAFMVADEYHNRHIASFLLKYLIQIAREHGVKGFFASVLLQNKAMVKVFLKSGYEVKIEDLDGEYRVTFTFDKPLKEQP